MELQSNNKNFKGQKIFMGIDVHKKQWSVAILTELGLLKRITQPPCASALVEYLSKNYPGGEYRAVYESGFCGFSAYYDLLEHGIQSMVVHAADVPGTQYQKAMKSDRVDAHKLASSLRAGLLKPIYILPKDEIDDRSVVRLRRTVIKDLSAYRTRIKHLLHTHGVLIPAQFDNPGTHWSNRFMLWLKQEVRLMSATRTSLDMLIRQAETARANQLHANRMVRALSQTPKYATDCKRLMAIPGIGLITAMTLLTEISDFARFKNEKQFASYLGLIPTSHSSGEKITHGEKTFRGNKLVGIMLVEASWVAVARVPKLGRDYLTFKQRMPPQKAIIKIAKKLSNIIFSVMKNKKMYEPYG